MPAGSSQLTCCSRVAVLNSCVFLVTSQGIQDALQRALSSMLQDSPRRRVALVTFSDEAGK